MQTRHTEAYLFMFMGKLVAVMTTATQTFNHTFFSHLFCSILFQTSLAP